jgi:hypothetical protein
MPKENTHLHFAHGVLEEFRGQAILQEISEYNSRYLLGSIIPDTFYYSSKESLTAVSEYIHGKTGNPTNIIILKVLDEARDARDIAFILGYITHCALDMTFHPVIYYLSGNYYDVDPGKKAHAVYLHRHLETCLDRDLKNTMRLHKIIMVTFLKDLVFEEIVSRDFRISIKDIRHTLKKQITFNKLFTSRPAYHLAKIAARCGLIEDTARLGLFYADVAGGECLPPLITVADLVTGQERVTTIDSLFTQARKKAVPMMRAAFSYWKGDIGREELISAIPGQSLDTGMMGVSTSSILYTKEDNTSPLR